jgi:hypothetical protein
MLGLNCHKKHFLSSFRVSHPLKADWQKDVVACQAFEVMLILP